MMGEKHLPIEFHIYLLNAVFVFYYFSPTPARLPQFSKSGAKFVEFEVSGNLKFSLIVCFESPFPAPIPAIRSLVHVISFVLYLNILRLPLEYKQR